MHPAGWACRLSQCEYYDLYGCLRHPILTGLFPVPVPVQPSSGLTDPTEVRSGAGPAGSMREFLTMGSEDFRPSSEFRKWRHAGWTETHSQVLVPSRFRFRFRFPKPVSNICFVRSNQVSIVRLFIQKIVDVKFLYKRKKMADQKNIFVASKQISGHQKNSIFSESSRLSQKKTFLQLFHFFKFLMKHWFKKITFREKDFPLSPTEIPREQICYKFFPWQIDKKIHAGNPWMPLLASHFASIMSVHSWVLKWKLF